MVALFCAICEQPLPRELAERGLRRELMRVQAHGDGPLVLVTSFEAAHKSQGCGEILVCPIVGSKHQDHISLNVGIHFFVAFFLAVEALHMRSCQCLASCLQSACITNRTQHSFRHRQPKQRSAHLVVLAAQG